MTDAWKSLYATVIVSVRSTVRSTWVVLKTVRAGMPGCAKTVGDSAVVTVGPAGFTTDAFAPERRETASRFQHPNPSALPQ